MSEMVLTGYKTPKIFAGYFGTWGSLASIWVYSGMFRHILEHLVSFISWFPLSLNKCAGQI